MAEREMDIQDFLDLELPDLALTTRVQQMLKGADVDLEVAEILGTIVYNLEKTLLDARIVVDKTRIACAHLATHVVKLESRLTEAGVPIQSDQEHLGTVVDAVQEAAELPL